MKRTTRKSIGKAGVAPLFRMRAENLAEAVGHRGEIKAYRYTGTNRISGQVAELHVHPSSKAGKALRAKGARLDGLSELRRVGESTWLVVKPDCGASAPATRLLIEAEVES